MKSKIPDWLIRTIKTFVQVFFGTLIVAVIPALETAPTLWTEVLPWFFSLFTPQLILGDCMSAAICAAWNIIKGEQNNLFVNNESNARLITEIMQADSKGEDFLIK